MPLFRIQQEALAAVAANRHPGSHIAGGTVINIHGSRFSKDIDIFHDLSSDDDRIRRLKETVDVDAASLSACGFDIEWKAEHPELYRAIVSKHGDATLLEWVIDSDYRFFPAIPDEMFGYRLDMFDLATNKVLAAASRKEPRDVVDLVYVHENCFPIGAALWAAPAKDPGCTPESLIEDIRRNALYRQDDYDRVISEPAVDARKVSQSIKTLLAQAADFVASMPEGYDGLAFLDDGGLIVEPDVSRLEEYKTVSARRQAHWPSSPDIGSRMITDGGKP